MTNYVKVHFLFVLKLSQFSNLHSVYFYNLSLGQNNVICFIEYYSA